jgi:hypothetical protein
MMKRVTWFAAGAAAGAVGAVAAGKKVRQHVDQLKPVNVARSAADRVKRRGQDVAAAVREGRGAARAKEAELKARRDGVGATVDLPGITSAAGPGTTINYIVLDPRALPAPVAAAMDELRPSPNGPRRRARRTH